MTEEMRLRRIIGSTVAAAIAAMAAAAGAAEITGTIEQIDERAGNIVVTDVAGDQPRVFAVPETGSAGATLRDLKEGDRVRISYPDIEPERGEPVDATEIEKLED